MFEGKALNVCLSPGVGVARSGDVAGGAGAAAADAGVTGAAAAVGAAVWGCATEGDGTFGAAGVLGELIGL